DICPVGALTSTDFRFKKRVWFLKTAKSVCTHCATGCNIKLDWDDASVYRYRPRENEAVNQCWMCDEGRLSYKFINDATRVLDPLMKKEGKLQKVEWSEALQKVLNVCGGSLGDVKVVGVLSAQSTCEENFALYHFIKNGFKNSKFLATKKEVENPSHDNFLIDADKNPNTNFLSLLGVGPLVGGPVGISTHSDEFPTGGIYFVLDYLTEVQKEKIIAANPRLVVWMTSNLSESGTWADVILPKPTFAEQNGTFINRQKRIQKADKAFEPKGHAKPVWETLAELAQRLDKPVSWNSAETVFAKLAQELKELNGVNYKQIGDQGLMTK
ncbi:MAG: molybdopterin-dependent oxidoreductase, partial [Deltaproteobacteria bacterium]|nr:molybdopterin-dependent oxidoreductase [Deltaproteobacteria bacterium]